MYIIVASSQASGSGNIHVSVIIGIVQALCFCGFQIFQGLSLLCPLSFNVAQGPPVALGVEKAGVAEKTTKTARNCSGPAGSLSPCAWSCSVKARSSPIPKHWHLAEEEEEEEEEDFIRIHRIL